MSYIWVWCRVVRLVIWNSVSDLVSTSATTEWSKKLVVWWYATIIPLFLWLCIDKASCSERTRASSYSSGDVWCICSVVITNRIDNITELSVQGQRVCEALIVKPYPELFFHVAVCCMFWVSWSPYDLDMIVEFGSVTTVTAWTDSNCELVICLCHIKVGICDGIPGCRRIVPVILVVAIRTICAVMGHSKGNISVCLTNIERLLTNSGQRKIVILALKVETNVECLISRISRFNGVRVLSHHANVK